MTSLRDLLDRFDLEFFGIWLLRHGASYWASGLRLEGVQFSRGDSRCPDQIRPVQLLLPNARTPLPVISMVDLKTPGVAPMALS